MQRTLFLAILICVFLLSGCHSLEKGKNALAWGDYEAAIAELQPLAEQGDAEAQRYLGIIYAKGFGVEKDSSEAASWFRRSAEQGNVQAQFNVGFLHERGEGVERNLELAAEWYERAATQGHAEATRRLEAMRPAD